eukprot:31115-Pelagococcus_subviridis.AAC.11
MYRRARWFASRSTFFFSRSMTVFSSNSASRFSARSVSFTCASSSSSKTAAAAAAAFAFAFAPASNGVAGRLPVAGAGGSPGGGVFAPPPPPAASAAASSSLCLRSCSARSADASLAARRSCLISFIFSAKIASSLSKSSLASVNLASFSLTSPSLVASCSFKSRNCRRYPSMTPFPVVRLRGLAAGDEVTRGRRRERGGGGGGVRVARRRQRASASPRHRLRARGLRRGGDEPRERSLAHLADVRELAREYERSRDRALELLDFDARDVSFRARAHRVLFRGFHRGGDLREDGFRARELLLRALRGVPQRVHAVLVQAGDDDARAGAEAARARRAAAAARAVRARRRQLRRRGVPVHDHLVPNVPRARGVLQLLIRGRHARDHARPRVSPQRVLKQSREFTLSVRHVHVRLRRRRLPSRGRQRPLLLPRERADDVPEREQPAVDVYALLEPRADGARALVSLRTRQVDEVELRAAVRASVRAHALSRQVPLLQDDREYRVRARRSGVHARRARRPRDGAVLQQTQHVVVRSRPLFANAAHDDGAVRALSYRDPLRRRASHDALRLASEFLRAREDVGDDARDDAHLVLRERVGRGGAHGVRLPAARLSVRENGRVVAVKARLHERRHEVFVHRALLRVRVVHLVEVEPSVLPEDDRLAVGRVREALPRALEALFRDERARAHGDAHGEVLPGVRVGGRRLRRGRGRGRRRRRGRRRVGGRGRRADLDLALAPRGVPVASRVRVRRDGEAAVDGVQPARIRPRRVRAHAARRVRAARAWMRRAGIVDPGPGF